MNLNFVPEEYIENTESRRTNFIYLALGLVVIVALAAVYATLSIQYQASVSKEQTLNIKMEEKKKEIRQVEQLQEKRNAMWKTALTTADLIEPVSKSLILASLTNQLPESVSLLKLNLVQELPKNLPDKKPKTKFDKEKSKKDNAEKPIISPEKLMETEISIEGISPSDLEVAQYIENLNESALLENICLVESKQRNVLNSTFRQFKLTAKLRKNAQLTDEEIENIKRKEQELELAKILISK